MDIPKIGFLIYKYKSDTISARERRVLENWIAESDSNKAFFEKLITSEELLNDYVEQYKIGQLTSPKEVWTRMVDRGMVQQAKVRWLSGWRKYSVAAALLVCCTLVYYVFLIRADEGTPLTTSKPEAVLIEPGQNKAMLTLDDGRTVTLDSAQDEIINQDGSIVTNKNGQLTYTLSSPKGSALRYNTLSTSRGQVYATVLSDGSKIWLNSSSSVRYPVLFPGGNRRIEIQGEAYFEVAHDKKRPFKAIVNGAVIEVLGTSFNVKAYDTSQIRATLLEGRVKIMSSLSGSQHSKTLTPGQQANIFSTGVSITKNVDLEEVMAWKNGMFFFKSANIPEIMAQLQRWYDVEARYLTDVNGLTFTGQVSKYDHISKVLEALELTKKLQFKLEERTILISKWETKK